MIKANNKSAPRLQEFFNVPVFTCIALFVLNNMYLKAAFHNLLTGKISDLCFCFFFPLYLSAMLSLVSKVRVQNRLLAGAVFTGLGMAMVKVYPPASDVMNNVFSFVTVWFVGQESLNIVDPTDLIALPLVGAAYYYGLYRYKV